MGSGSVPTIQVRTIVDMVRTLGLLEDLSKLDAFRAPLESCATAALRSVHENFIDQGRPVAWTPLKPITIALRRVGSGTGSAKILQDTGHLMRSVTTPGAPGNIFRVDDHAAAVGTNVPYAAIQNAGGTVSIKNKRVLARKVDAGVAEAAAAAGYKVSRDKSGQSYVIFGKSVKIPARPFMILQDEDREHFGLIFARWLHQHMEGAAE